MEVTLIFAVFEFIDGESQNIPAQNTVNCQVQKQNPIDQVFGAQQQGV